MISFEYAAVQLVAVWRMAINNPGWRDSLDRSVDGVFRSFFAILFAAPFTIFSYLALQRAAGNLPDIPATPMLEAPLPFFIFWEATAYLLDWAVSLGVIVLVAKAVNAERNVAQTIIAFNWTQVLTAAAQAAPFAAMTLTTNAAIVGTVALPALVFSIFVYWGVLRRGLDVSAGVVIALIGAFAIVGIIVSSIVSQVALLFLRFAS